MSTTEIRVRPVVRHAVTRFKQDARSAGSEMIGEFANEAFAEEVASALTWKSRARQYVIVERSFDVTAQVGYADYESVAEAIREDMEKETGREFRVFSRELTDALSIARVQMQTEEEALATHRRPGVVVVDHRTLTD